jgi:asparagine synthase (glutamine-hydrolysing)
VVTTDVKDLLPKLARCFDQPFADSSAIPNYYISQLTREYVTVALSGLGGDEIGAGYERYLGMVFAETYRKLPKALRHCLLERWVLRAREDKADQLWLNRIKRFIAAADLAAPARYASMQSTYSLVDQERLLARDFRGRSQAIAPESLMARAMKPELVDSVLNGALLADLHSYLPGDLLTLTDRVSMRHSLEVRVPFLDHRLVELTARVPARHKASGWTKKKLLKQAFSSLLPREILHRKRMGFSVPLALWLRTELSSTMKDVLSPEELKRVSYLNASEVESLMAEHLSGKANHENKLWALINLVYWHREFPNVSL